MHGMLRRDGKSDREAIKQQCTGCFGVTEKPDREAVKHHSPGSRSAPRESRPGETTNPNGVQPTSVPDITLIDFQTIFCTQPPKFILERFLAMMLRLIRNVLYQRIDVAWTDRERSVPRLPIEITNG